MWFVDGARVKFLLLELLYEWSLLVLGIHSVRVVSSGSDASLPKTLYVIPALCTMTQWPSEP